MNHSSSDPSKAYKWATLIFSAVTAGFLVAAVRENVTTDWRRHQTVFKRILESKATDGAPRLSFPSRFAR